MINKDYSDLISPALLIIAGLYIRFGKNEKLSVPGRKYWLFSFRRSFYVCFEIIEDFMNNYNNCNLMFL